MSGENQNESKFMAMLERRGIVRRVVEPEVETTAEAVAAQPQVAAHTEVAAQPQAVAHAEVAAYPQAEIHTEVAAQPQAVAHAEVAAYPQAVTHTEAAAQPQAVAYTDSTNTQYSENLSAYHDLSSAAPVAPYLQEEPQYDPAASAQVPVAPSEWYPSEQSYETPIETSVPAPEYTAEHAHQPYPAEPYAQNVVHDEAAAYYQTTEETTSRDTLFAWMDKEEAAAVAPAPVDNSTERYLDIEELYELLSLKSKKTDTIYLIEDYIKSIPESLPDESRRQIITKIVAASGFDYDLLMGDGILRVKMLKEYAEKFARYTDDYVEARQTEVAALENELSRVHSLIDDRRELHKKQFLSIEAEAGRLREILTFING